jgi:transposase
LVAPRVEALLTAAPSFTGGKQRLTAVRLHRMLREEGLDVGETLVKDLVREWRRRRREVFVPLEYQPGDLAEVDFFEVLVDLAGTRRKAWMFVMRLMHSGRDFAWLYERQDQVAFLDGHVRAFEHFAAVPHRIAYDNLRAAVTRVLVGAERELAPRFAAMVHHYLLEPSFARVGTGHDKGGVEARGKLVRWQHLVPIPRADDLDTISRELLARLDRQAETQSDAQGRTVASRFAEERPLMLPLPATPFRAAAVELCSASRRALVRAGAALYSVWSTWAGLDLTVYLGVRDVEIVGPDGRVRHPRQPRGGRSVLYRHYLSELAHKPQAMRQVAHKLIEELGEPFTLVWRQLVDEAGPKRAAQTFARILDRLLVLGETEVRERLQRSLATGEPPLLALATIPPEVAVPLDALPARLQGVEVAAGSAADYDALLGGAR